VEANRNFNKKISNEILSSNKKYDVILGITNGGIIPARLIARELDINRILFIPVRSKELHIEGMAPMFDSQKYLAIDDIYDTGNTYPFVSDKIGKFDCDFAFLVRRFAANDDDIIESGRKIYVGEILNHKKWIVFPWEPKTDNILGVIN
jgi:hypoxanthine phosphoribosyltransferase